MDSVQACVYLTSNPRDDDPFRKKQQTATGKNLRWRDRSARTRAQLKAMLSFGEGAHGKFGMRGKAFYKGRGMPRIAAELGRTLKGRKYR